MKRWIVFLLILSLLLVGCSREEKLPDMEAVEDSGMLKIGVTQCPPFAMSSYIKYDVGSQRSGQDIKKPK